MTRAAAFALTLLATLAAAQIADRIAFGLAMCRQQLSEGCPT